MRLSCRGAAFDKSTTLTSGCKVSFLLKALYWLTVSNFRISSMFGSCIFKIRPSIRDLPAPTSKSVKLVVKSVNRISQYPENATPLLSNNAIKSASSFFKNN